MEDRTNNYEDNNLRAKSGAGNCNDQQHLQSDEVTYDSTKGGVEYKAARTSTEHETIQGPSINSNLNQNTRSLSRKMHQIKRKLQVVNKNNIVSRQSNNGMNGKLAEVEPYISNQQQINSANQADISAQNLYRKSMRAFLQQQSGTSGNPILSSQSQARLDGQRKSLTYKPISNQSSRNTVNIALQQPQLSSFMVNAANVIHVPPISEQFYKNKVPKTREDLTSLGMVRRSRKDSYKASQQRQSYQQHSELAEYSKQFVKLRNNLQDSNTREVVNVYMGKHSAARNQSTKTGGGPSTRHRKLSKQHHQSALTTQETKSSRRSKNNELIKEQNTKNRNESKQRVERFNGAVKGQNMMPPILQHQQQQSYGSNQAVAEKSTNKNGQPLPTSSLALIDQLQSQLNLASQLKQSQSAQGGILLPKSSQISVLEQQIQKQTPQQTQDVLNATAERQVQSTVDLISINSSVTPQPLKKNVFDPSVTTVKMDTSSIPKGSLDLIYTSSSFGNPMTIIHNQQPKKTSNNHLVPLTPNHTQGLNNAANIVNSGSKSSRGMKNVFVNNGGTPALSVKSKQMLGRVTKAIDEQEKDQLYAQQQQNSQRSINSIAKAENNAALKLSEKINTKTSNYQNHSSKHSHFVMYKKKQKVEKGNSLRNKQHKNGSLSSKEPQVIQPLFKKSQTNIVQYQANPSNVAGKLQSSSASATKTRLNLINNSNKVTASPGIDTSTQLQQYVKLRQDNQPNQPQRNSQTADGSQSQKNICSTPIKFQGQIDNNNNTNLLQKTQFSLNPRPTYRKQVDGTLGQAGDYQNTSTISSNSKSTFQNSAQQIIHSTSTNHHRLPTGSNSKSLQQTVTQGGHLLLPGTTTASLETISNQKSTYAIQEKDKIHMEAIQNYQPTEPKRKLLQNRLSVGQGGNSSLITQQQQNNSAIYGDSPNDSNNVSQQSTMTRALGNFAQKPSTEPPTRQQSSSPIRQNNSAVVQPPMKGLIKNLGAPPQVQNQPKIASPNKSFRVINGVAQIQQSSFVANNSAQPSASAMSAQQLSQRLSYATPQPSSMIVQVSSRLQKQQQQQPTTQVDSAVIYQQKTSKFYNNEERRNLTQKTATEVQYNKVIQQKQQQIAQTINIVASSSQQQQKTQQALPPNPDSNQKELPIIIRALKNEKDLLDKAQDDEQNSAAQLANKRSSTIPNKIPFDNAYVQDCYKAIFQNGNNTGLIRQVMMQRNWWIEIQAIQSNFNFKWNPVSQGIKFARLGHLDPYKQLYDHGIAANSAAAASKDFSGGRYAQMVNHVEHHQLLTEKYNLLQVMLRHCEIYKENTFDLMPITFFVEISDASSKAMVTSALQPFIQLWQSLEINKKCLKELEQRLLLQLSQKAQLEKQTSPKKKQNNQAYQDQVKKLDSVTSQIPQTLQHPLQNSSKTTKFKAFTFEKKTNYQKNTMPLCHFDSFNLWLLKPTHLNRGRGIHVFNDVETLHGLIRQYCIGKEENYTRGKDNKDDVEQDLDKDENQTAATASPMKITNKSSNNSNKIKHNTFIIQKYIERPLLIFKRKFDIRVWVLLNQDHEIFFFKEGYLRTSSSEFGIDLQNIDNAFVHLTNNAVQKFAENYGDFEDGNQLSFPAFQSYIDKHYASTGISVENHLVPQMKEIILKTFSAVRRTIDPNRRKFCFELFGYDFILDEDFNQWLIEVNTNPCLEESSGLLKKLLPRMIEDMLKLTIDVVYPRSSIRRRKNKPQQQRASNLGNSPIKKAEVITSVIGSAKKLNTNTTEQKSSMQTSTDQATNFSQSASILNPTKESKTTINDSLPSGGAVDFTSSQVAASQIAANADSDINNEEISIDLQANKQPTAITSSTNEIPLKTIKEQTTTTSYKSQVFYPVPGYSDTENLWDRLGNLDQDSIISKVTRYPNNKSLCTISVQDRVFKMCKNPTYNGPLNLYLPDLPQDELLPLEEQYTPTMTEEQDEQVEEGQQDRQQLPQ